MSMHLGTIDALGHISIWQKLHLGRLSIFAALSVADLFMTCQLLHAGNGEIYESNPVAEAWLSSYGWLGLSVYKALAMTLVIVSALYVSLHRPRLGGRLLAFACLATATVVIYSCYIAHDDLANRVTNHDVDAVMSQTQKLDRELVRQRAYQTLLVQLGHDLVKGRCSLCEAAHSLGSTEMARNPDWLEQLHRKHPGHRKDECLAIHIGQHALGTVQHDAEFQALTERLQGDFAKAFNHSYDFNTVVSPTQVDPRVPQSTGRPARLETISED